MPIPAPITANRGMAIPRIIPLRCASQSVSPSAANALMYPPVLKVRSRLTTSRNNSGI